MRNAVDRREEVGGDLEAGSVIAVGVQHSPNHLDHVSEDLESDPGLGARGCVFVPEKHRVDTRAGQCDVDVRIALAMEPFMGIGDAGACLSERSIELQPRPFKRIKNQCVTVIEVAIDGGRADPGCTSHGSQADRFDRAMFRHQLHGCGQEALLGGRRFGHITNYRLTRVHLMRMVAVNTCQHAATHRRFS